MIRRASQAAGSVRASVIIAAMAIALLLLMALPSNAIGQADSPALEATTSAERIANIGEFLEQCPTNDPRYSQIRADFEIRKEGAVVGAIPCSEPISAMPVAQYTDELIAAQTLRAVFYMEGGRSVPYPWTSGSFYDWMKSKIGGIDIRNNNSYCCESFNGKWFVVLSSQGEIARNYARQWPGLSERIGLIGHETRHVNGYPHVGGCPLFPDLTYGCDQTYDEGDLSPYGIQWWLNAKWLSGEVNVGYSCLPPDAVLQIANWHLIADNNDFGLRYVDNSPPVLTKPQWPGGPCPSPADTDGDGVYDADEVACGGDPNNPMRRPERVDGSFAGVDDDADSRIDEGLPAGSEAFDCDGDGFSGTIESAIGTAPQAGCPDPAHGVTDAWPLDNNTDGTADVLDVFAYRGKTPGAVPPQPKRLDLDNNNSLNVSDILIFSGKVPGICS